MKIDFFSLEAGVVVLSFAIFAILAALKIGGYIGLSWWLITAPIWGLALLSLIVVLVALILLRNEKD